MSLKTKPKILDLPTSKHSNGFTIENVQEGFLNQRKIQKTNLIIKGNEEEKIYQKIT